GGVEGISGQFSKRGAERKVHDKKNGDRPQAIKKWDLLRRRMKEVTERAGDQLCLATPRRLPSNGMIARFFRFRFWAVVKQLFHLTPECIFRSQAPLKGEVEQTSSEPEVIRSRARKLISL